MDEVKVLLKALNKALELTMVVLKYTLQQRNKVFLSREQVLEAQDLALTLDVLYQKKLSSQVQLPSD